MAICLFCDAEFIQKNKRGRKQKYCSHSCSCKDYHQKHKEQIYNRKKTYYINTKEIHNKVCSVWYLNNKEKRLALNVKYLRAKNNQTPVWANQKYIELFYKLAKIEEKRIGKKIEVDHIIPLKGKNVCGLHCESNLQLLLASDNRIKKNKFKGEGAWQ